MNQKCQERTVRAAGGPEVAPAGSGGDRRLVAMVTRGRAGREAERGQWRAIVRDAWRVVRTHPLALILPGTALFVVFGVPAAILDKINTDTGLGQVALASTVQLAGLVAAFLYYGYCEEIVRRSRAGGDVSVAAALAETARVVPALILAGFVTWVCIMVGFALLILPGVWLLTRWAVVSQVISFEHLGLVRSIRRSAQLTRGRMRLVASTVVLAIVVSELATGLAGELGRSLAGNETFGRIVGAAAGQLLAGPFTGVIVATVYFRLLATEADAQGAPAA